MKKFMTSLLLIGSLFLAACGNGSDSGEDASNNVTTEVTVAVENASNPLSFTDETGELTGYEVDVLRAIEDEMPDYHFNIESVDAEATQVGLDTGKYDLVGGGLFQTAERQNMYLFPTENTGKSLIKIYKAKGDDSITSLDDLHGKKVGPVTPNGGIFNLFTEYNKEHPDNQIDIVPGESGATAELLQGVDNGSYDAVVKTSNLGNQEVIDELDLAVEEVAEPVQVNDTFFMFSKDNEELVAAFDKAAAHLKETGKLQEISEKWYGEDIFQYQAD